MKLKAIAIISAFSALGLNQASLEAQPTFAQRTGHFTLGSAKLVTAITGTIIGSLMIFRGGTNETSKVVARKQLIEYDWTDRNFIPGLVLSMPLLWYGAYNLGLSGINSIKKAFKREQ